MKKILFLTTILLACFASWGQGKFFKIFDDNGYDYGQGIVQLKDSSYMITGSSSSFADAPAQAFLMKIDKNGNHLWAKEYGFSEADGGKRVLSAFNDSIFFILGYSQNPNGSGFDILVIKTDSNGVELEKKTFGSTAWERINDAVLMGDSMIYAVGETANTANSNTDCFLLKMNMNCDTLWTKKWGSTGEDNLKAIKSFDAASFISVGAYYNEDSLMTKCYVAKFDFDGNLLWGKKYGANGKYWLNDFYLYNGGIYAVGGQHNEQYNDRDEFLLRIHDDGTPNLWDFENPEDGEGEVLGAVLYANNSKSYIVRHFKNQYSASGSFDVRFMRYENSLDYEWSNPNPPSISVNFQLDDEFGQLINTLDGAWVAVGSTPSQVNGGMASYVLKADLNDVFPMVDYSTIHSLVELSTIEGNEVKIYPNPASNFLIIESENEVSAQILDLFGKEIAVLEMKNYQKIDISNWNSGVYFVQITNSNGAIGTVKLIKN